jgi:hypothetical protein
MQCFRKVVRKSESLSVLVLSLSSNAAFGRNGGGSPSHNAIDIFVTEADQLIVIASTGLGRLLVLFLVLLRDGGVVVVERLAQLVEMLALVDHAAHLA